MLTRRQALAAGPALCASLVLAPEAVAQEPKYVVIEPGLTCCGNLTEAERRGWRLLLQEARNNPDFKIFTSMRVLVLDPTLKGQIVVMPHASPKELSDTWLGVKCSGFITDDDYGYSRGNF